MKSDLSVTKTLLRKISGSGRSSLQQLLKFMSQAGQTKNKHIFTWGGQQREASGETWQNRPVGVLHVRWQNLEPVKFYH